MYREEIKVLDCTIRDGGLINNHYFTDEFVRAVYKSLSEAGIDYMEMGYRSSRKYAPPGDFGAWKYCDDDKIREIIDGIESNIKLSIMVDADGGSVQTIWLDDEGAVVPEPRSGTDAVTAGVAAAAMSTTLVAAFWVFVSLCVRRIADRRRFRLWDQDWAALDSPSRR